MSDCAVWVGVVVVVVVAPTGVPVWVGVPTEWPVLRSFTCIQAGLPAAAGGVGAGAGVDLAGVFHGLDLDTGLGPVVLGAERSALSSRVAEDGWVFAGEWPGGCHRAVYDPGVPVLEGVAAEALLDGVRV